NAGQFGGSQMGSAGQWGSGQLASQAGQFGGTSMNAGQFGGYQGSQEQGNLYSTNYTGGMLTNS
ncbi:hypothetical protein, partial [Desulfotomaculum copahuensis]|uniref:hypothetical protein n=1 Tax=Desulfotomaculum copahuensis TaxID=1838280 RepID=UPI003D0237F6